MTSTSRLALIGWIAGSMAAGLFGSRFAPGAWYAALNKPSWNPPGWVFGPVWTALYVMMGVAAWLVWRKAGFAGARLAFVVFIVQLMVNAAWSYVFFGQQRPDLAFANIVVLWLLIVATVILFRRVTPPAAALLLPYLAWVSFASILNLRLWQLNP